MLEKRFQKSCPRWVSIPTDPREAACLFWDYLYSTVAALRGNVCQKSQSIGKKGLKKGQCIWANDFTNSSDSNKNKFCQFCRMCSFLFTASGGKRCSDALRHGKKSSSRSVLAEQRPLSCIQAGQFCFILIVLYKFIVSEKLNLICKQPMWNPMEFELGGEPTGGINSTAARWMLMYPITCLLAVASFFSSLQK